MNSPLQVGLTHEKVLKTGPEHSARHFYPDLPDVFGTPFLVGLFEGVSAELMAPHLGPGEQSVGISMNLKHLAPTPLGMEVRAKTEVTQVEGRKLTFKVEAFDEKEKIGEAIHERFIINVEKFNQKVEAKKG
jgi:fluoroacetyl-CoA thioesterase|uniref:Fluoroacetyl-CoA-specific thioesterase-like domain-containing protein n=1 Tax=Desulfobacca acetoxidans TaxID=60893 RepID=A0A7C5AKP4_9BACT